MSSSCKKRRSPQAAESQSDASLKRRRRPPPDALWCLENLATLNLKTFSLRFGLTDKLRTLTRYRNILNKWVDNDVVKNNLLDDLDRWTGTVEFVAFWQERARTATVVRSRAACSAFVDTLIMDVTPGADSEIIQEKA